MLALQHRQVSGDCTDRHEFSSTRKLGKRPCGGIDVQKNIGKQTDSNLSSISHECADIRSQIYSIADCRSRKIHCASKFALLTVWTKCSGKLKPNRKRLALAERVREMMRNVSLTCLFFDSFSLLSSLPRPAYCHPQAILII